MGRESPRRKLTLNKESLARLTLSPAELQRVVGGAGSVVFQQRLASNSKFCQSDL